MFMELTQDGFHAYLFSNWIFQVDQGRYFIRFWGQLVQCPRDELRNKKMVHGCNAWWSGIQNITTGDGPNVQYEWTLNCSLGLRKLEVKYFIFLQAWTLSSLSRLHSSPLHCFHIILQSITTLQYQATSHKALADQQLPPEQQLVVIIIGFFHWLIMSEYGLSSAQGRGHMNPQYGAQAAPNVEWYSSGSQQQQYSNYNYHEQSFASSSGAQYGTFEDEAPLLEGAVCSITTILATESYLILKILHPSSCR